MNVMLQTYRCLLADVALASGYSEIRGSSVELPWCLNEAPKLEKYLLGCLETSTQVDYSRFPVSLRRLARSSVIDGLHMRYLRQILLFCYKAYVQHDNITTSQAFKTFATTNDSVREFGNSFSKASPRLLGLTRKHVRSVLYGIKLRHIVPFHGPGATTTPKERWTKWFSSIESVFPYSDYYCCYYNSDHISELGEVPSDEHIVAKLIAVPKDSRGPRLICVHPAEAIWLQQGLRVALERAIEQRRSSKGPWPCGRVRFDDQECNGRIALLSSKSGIYATLDMKEASDRISDVLVQDLFGPYYKYFGCCRAQKYVTLEKSEDYRDDNIHCYAPMGNATTFPVQSLVFWAICCASMQSRGFRQPGAVFVFGDDIIVRTECAPYICEDLESFGLCVNRTKSFWRSRFRESCGVDAFNGINVTPVRWKSDYYAEHLEDLLSISDTAMRLRIAGYECAASGLYYILRCKLQRKYGLQLFFTNNRNHSGIAEYVQNQHSYVWRDAYWHRDLHKFVSPVYKIQRLEGKPSRHGWNHVVESLSSLTRTGRSSVPDRALSRGSRLKRGWTDIM